ncbi:MULTISPECIES: hypothetical protein [unclassified Mycobacterium]|uniref:hypothetical protein n=1 Tax=unclassified Mycobacterium TaxID=2642494 RepID=UPI0029C92C2A|nr:MULTISPECIES: hypothetical protein [unclassified Mycobacterium]
MLADTAAIHAFGAAQARHAADLEAITGHLVGVGAALAPDALGPVGARFLEALSEAVAREVRVVRTLGERVAAAAGTARVTAEAYVATERGAGHAMSELGV